MLLVYLACAPLAWGTMVFMIALGDDPSHPHTQAQIDAGFRTSIGVATVVTLVGAVVLMIPLARRTLGIRKLGHALIMDGAVASGAFVGFVVGLG